MSEGILSASIIQSPRAYRLCSAFQCGQAILPGTPTLRIFGCAHHGDPPYALHLHLDCAKRSKDPLIQAKLKGLLR